MTSGKGTASGTLPLTTAAGTLGGKVLGNGGIDTAVEAGAIASGDAGLRSVEDLAQPKLVSNTSETARMGTNVIACSFYLHRVMNRNRHRTTTHTRGFGRDAT